jgi:hypothetical protein
LVALSLELASAASNYQTKDSSDYLSESIVVETGREVNICHHRQIKELGNFYFWRTVIFVPLAHLGG